LELDGNRSIHCIKLNQTLGDRTYGIRTSTDRSAVTLRVHFWCIVSGSKEAVEMISKRKKGISRKRYYLVLGFTILTPILFGIAQVWAVIRVISLYGWHREPAFWAGALFWSTLGFFQHDLRILLRKKAAAIIVFSFSIIALGHLATTGKFPTVFQFMMWGGLWVVMMYVRVLVEEVREGSREATHDNAQNEKPKLASQSDSRHSYQDAHWKLSKPNATI